MGESLGESAPLIVSVSGIRGIVGASLTPTVVTNFAAAFGTPRSGKRIVVSRDGRGTGEMLRSATIAGLLAVGCEVEDIGIASTPTCGFYVKATGAAGAIQITASHNPPPWNGLKLFRPEGFVLSPSAGQKVADDYAVNRWTFVPWDGIRSVKTVAEPHRLLLDRVLSLVDVNAIRNRKFRVVLDANHGSGAVFGPKLLDELGCEVHVLGGIADGKFEHQPEPTEANLTGLCDAVRQRGADLGFATDPDADRLAIVDDQGTYIGEEYTLALAIRHRTATEKGPVVINSSTSRVSQDVATGAGCPVYRTKVGEVHVAERMVAERALIGGEGNGGVIDPRVVLGRDSAIGMALTLELLTKAKASLSEYMRSMPAYAIQKDKFPVHRDRLGESLARIKKEFSDGALDESDGLRVDWEDGWVQVRASNTEPIVRVIAEARQAERARQLCERVAKWVTG
ncbi:MAG: phosphoglucosamine mutase [Planctomycetota bacterium]